MEFLQVKMLNPVEVGTWELQGLSLKLQSDLCQPFRLKEWAPVFSESRDKLLHFQTTISL
jgi:hypothetical protein